VGLPTSLATAARLASEASAQAHVVAAEVSAALGVPAVPLDGATALLQDVAFYAVQRRS
jgi:hypothetical protein